MPLRPISYIVLLLFFFCSIPNLVFGQEPADVDLDKIIVSGSRSEGSLSGTADNVIVVDQKEIEQLPARNLGEALSYIPGVDILPRKGFGQSTSISIQGSDSRQVRIMVDGIPFNSQSSGQVNPSALPLDNIKQIEIIKGASSSLWGSGLGGVVNIITKDTGTTSLPSGNVKASIAEFRTKEDNAQVSGKMGNMGYYLYSGYMESGGRGPKNDVLEKKGFGKLTYDLADLGKLNSSFGYSGAQVNSGEFPDGSWQSQPYRSRYGKIGWEGNPGPADIRLDFKHSRQDIVTRSYLSIVDEEPAFLVRTSDYLYQVSLNSAFHPRGKDILVVGGDFDWDMLKSNVYLSDAKRVSLQAPFTNYTVKFSSIDLNFGARYDHNSEFGHQASPAAGFVFRIPDSANTIFKFKVSRAFNSPPLLWKFNDNPILGVAPNPDIRPERATVYETVLETHPFSNLWLTGSLYRSDVRDALSLQENESGMLLMKNFDKFRRQGGELTCRMRLWEWLTAYGSGEFNDIEDRSTQKTVKGGGKPRQRFNAGLRYANKKGFELDAKGYYFFWNEPEDSQANDQKMLCDLKATQQYKFVTVFVAVYNLTNSQYWQDYFFPVPRRYFEGGCTILW